MTAAVAWPLAAVVIAALAYRVAMHWIERDDDLGEDVAQHGRSIGRLEQEVTQLRGLEAKVRKLEQEAKDSAFGASLSRR